jgi:hypothetical protein
MFAEAGSCFPKNRHVVPESQLPQANALATQVVAQFFNLCAFACAVNSGKCDQYGFQMSFLEKNMSRILSQWPGLFGTCPGLAADSPTTVPIAMPAPAKKPSLIKSERICRCFGGAIATPAGLEAAPPLTSTGGATAVPLGC